MLAFAASAGARHGAAGSLQLLAHQAMLFPDGLYLASVACRHGGNNSSLRVLVLFHLIAVALLRLVRTGLKLALWPPCSYTSRSTRGDRVLDDFGRNVELWGVPVRLVGCLDRGLLARCVRDRELRFSQ